MYRFCMACSEFHGRYYSVLVLNKVVLATLRYVCIDVIKTMLLVIMAASSVIFGVQIRLFW